VNCIVQSFVEKRTEECMKRITWIFITSLVFACPVFPGGKSRKPDGRLKQIHTVFIKDEHNPASATAQTNLEKWTCLKAAPSGAQADAVISVLWVKESKNTPDVGSSVAAAVSRPLSIGENLEYRTTLVVNAREGSKFKKIWSKSVALGESDERHKSGVTRLMEELKADACSQP
jgi:hypothetical protein